MSLLSNGMLSYIANLFLPKPFREYRYLSDNLVESETYEIRKLIHGPIDSILYVHQAKVFLVKTGNYLWKINAQGYIVDTWDSKGCMFSSGYCFTPDYFIDWVHTGNKAKQKYSKFINANKMPEDKLKNYLDKADIVEFGVADKSNHSINKDGTRLGMAFLKMEGQTIAMDITDRYDRIDTHCDKIEYSYGFGEGEYQKIGWDKTCLGEYEKKYQDKLVFLQDSLPYIYDWEDRTQAVSMQKFVKEGYRVKEGLLTSSMLTILNGFTWLVGQPIIRKVFLFEGYWLGKAYLQISHHSEQLNFKVLSSYDEANTIKATPITMFDFPDAHNAEMRLIRKNGLYAIRKKISHTTKPANELVKNNITSGPSPDFRTHNPWHPEFTGLMSTPITPDYRGTRSRRSIWGKIYFFNSVEEPFPYLLDTAAVSSGLYAIPKKLSFNWEGDNINSAFKLHLSDKKFAWYHLHDANTDTYHFYDPDTDVFLELIFDEAEIVSAFQKLDRGKHPLHLEMHMEEKGKTGAILSVSLRNNIESIQLKKIQFEYDEPRYFNDEVFFRQQFEKSKMEIEFENALKDEKYLQDYLDVAADIATRSPYIKEYAYLAGKHSNELINGLTTKNDLTGAAKVANHYIDKIFPFTGRTGVSDEAVSNIEVIASNSLAVSIMSQNEKLSGQIFGKLLGPDFNVTKLKNATLLYNVACYYVGKREKKPMLQAVKLALASGKTADQFMKDADFKGYLNDADFMSVLADAPHKNSGIEDIRK